MYQATAQRVQSGNIYSNNTHHQQTERLTGTAPVLLKALTGVFLLLVTLFALLVTSTPAQAVPVTALESIQFTRQNGLSVTEKHTFLTEDLNGTFVLTVYNGGLEDDTTLGSFVSSSTITLNGVVVVGPQNFDEDVTVISVPVSLTSANELAVILQGKPGGVITVEITGNVNNTPFADAGINQNVEVGSTVALDGSGSFDDDGDALTYQWTLIAQPSGSLTTLNNATAASASFVADVPGNYVAGLIVNDGQLDSSQSQVSISALAPNDPPVLDVIGNQTVELGTTLTLNLSATDPDGDVLSYSAQPLPLPAGASLDGQTGAVFGGALGCLLLLLKKSAAHYVFITSLLGAIVTMIHTLGMAGSDAGPVEFLIGNLVQLAVTVFLIWYSKRAESKGWISQKQLLSN